MEANKAKGVQEIGQRVLQRIATAAATSAAGFSPEQQEQMKEGETVYKSLCFDLPRRGCARRRRRRRRGWRR